MPEATGTPRPLPMTGANKPRDRALDLPAAPVKPAEKFRKTVQIDSTACIQEAHQDLAREFSKPILRHATGDQRVVVRPD